MLKDFLLIMSFGLFSVTFAVAGESVAWVDSFEGKADNYALLRDGKMVPVAIYLSLEVGDEIAVRQEGDALQLSYADGRSETITSTNSPYSISSEVETPSVARNMLAWVGRSLNDWYEDGESDGHGIEMRSRDPDLFNKPKLEVPLFNEGENFIVAGERQLTIPWRGGRGPYSISIYEDGNDNPLYKVSEVDGERVRTGKLRLKEGQAYVVKVADIGETLEVKVNAKAESELPKPPEELSNGQLPSETKTTFVAAWLAGVHDEWLIEGYQMVSQVDEDYVPARLLKYELEQGNKP